MEGDGIECGDIIWSTRHIPESKDAVYDEFRKQDWFSFLKGSAKEKPD